MKQASIRHLLEKGASCPGFELDNEKIILLDEFAQELAEAGRSLNLTSITDPLEIAETLMLDSIYPGKFLPENGRILDLGTGAGFPGIPLKIARPGLCLTLIDGRRKKISFVKYIIRKLQLENIEAFHERAEALGDRGAAFDAVLCRAAASLSSFINTALPLLKKGGVLAAMKGRAYEKELSDAGAFMKTASCSCRISVERYSLPISGIERALVLIKAAS